MHYRDVESYRREGERTVIGLAGNSKIDIDWNARRYSVVVNGVEVASDGNTFCPIGNDRVAFYSKAGKRLSTVLPKGWDSKAIAALALYVDKAEEVPVNLAGGKVTLEVPPGRPVMVFRDGDAARKQMSGR